MKDEILAKALDSDTEIVPRYDVVLPDGTKVAENAELVLKNPVTQEGTPYNKEAVLQDATAALYGLEDATVDEVLGIIPSLYWDEIARFDEAGAFTWTADFDGKIGIFLIGGGGIGASNVYSSTSRDYSLSGGASGYVKHTTITVQTGDQISIIVGAGGKQSGAAGGSTSAMLNGNSIVADGGLAGRVDYGTIQTNEYIVPGGAPAYMAGNGYYGTEEVAYYYSSTATHIHWPTWLNINPFTGEEVCGSGGGARNAGSGNSVNQYAGGKKPLTSLGGGNASAVMTGNAQGEDASLPGCGGGAATTRQSGRTATPGNGADGIAIIYRKIEVSAA